MPADQIEERRSFSDLLKELGENDIVIEVAGSGRCPSEGAQVPVLPTRMLSGHARKKQPVQIVSYGKEKTKDTMPRQDRRRESLPLFSCNPGLTLMKRRSPNRRRPAIS